MATDEEITGGFEELEKQSEAELNKTGKLSDRQEAFCWAYLSCLNAAKAARQAGYSHDTAREQGCRLLTKVHITDRITEIRSQSAGKFDISKEFLIQELAAIAKFDLREVYNNDGTLKPPQEWSDEAGAALAGVEVDEIKEFDGENMVTVSYTKKVKRDNKIGAITQLSKMLGYDAPAKSEVQMNVAPIIIDWNDNEQPAD